MVVLHRDTGFAETTMLAPCRFEEFTCLALVPSVEDNTIIGVPRHLLCVVLRGDIRRGDHRCVQKDIRHDYRNRSTNAMDSGHSRPCYREKHELPCDKQGREENLPTPVSNPASHTSLWDTNQDQRVVLIPHITAGIVAAIQQPSTK